MNQRVGKDERDEVYAESSSGNGRGLELFPYYFNPERFLALHYLGPVRVSYYQSPYLFNRSHPAEADIYE